MTRNAKKLSLRVFIIAIIVSAASGMLIERAGRLRPVSSRPDEATNAAFRDGLYQGKLVAEHGREARPSVGRGRWNSEQDRASFISGYLQGYGQVLASNPSQSH